MHKIQPQSSRLPDLTLSSTAILLLLFTLSAAADYEEGVNAAFSGDFGTAYREFTISAEAGLDVAQYNLAILYFSGQGVEQDFAQAFKWTEAAAQQGHLNAQYNLGSLYLEGQGTQKNVARGLDWFKRAGRSGHANAAYALAKMLENGDIISKDLVEAHAWAATAANNEHKDGIILREKIEQKLTPNDLSEARRIFASWQIEPLPPIMPN